MSYQYSPKEDAFTLHAETKSPNPFRDSAIELLLPHKFSMDMLDHQDSFSSFAELLPLPVEKPKRVCQDDHTGRPTIPYAALITKAIEGATDQKITLNGIYQYAMLHYPYFRTAGNGWKNSIRHNLSLNKNFARVARPANERGKGAYWTLTATGAKKRLREKSEEFEKNYQEPLKSYLKPQPVRYDSSESLVDEPVKRDRGYSFEPASHPTLFLPSFDSQVSLGESTFSDSQMSDHSLGGFTDSLGLNSVNESIGDLNNSGVYLPSNYYNGLENDWMAYQEPKTYSLSEIEKQLIAQAAVEAVWNPSSSFEYPLQDTQLEPFKWDALA